MKIAVGILVALFLSITLGFVGTGLNKAYWDARVKALCEMEGGITVYETVRLSEEEYLRYGGATARSPFLWTTPGERRQFHMRCVCRAP